MAHLYFVEDAQDSEFAPGSVLRVTGDEARHAVRVSRLREGEHVLIGNGRGAIAHGQAVDVGRDEFAVAVETSRVEEPPARRLVLVQALAKGDRDERAVELATELGVDAVIPWQAERSVSRWDHEKIVKGLAKWSRIAREASKQAIRARIPVVAEPVSLTGLAELARTGHCTLLVLHPFAALPLSEWARTVLPAVDPASDIYLVVGPEGGFTDDEVATLVSASAHVVKLGDTVLRTSSAGSAALAVLNVAVGRW